MTKKVKSNIFEIIDPENLCLVIKNIDVFDMAIKYGK